MTLCSVMLGLLISAFTIHLLISWYHRTRYGIRRAYHAIHPLLLQRHSPRAMSGKVLREELNQLFEAARWAQSSYNAQPWYFIYAFRDTPPWQTFFDLLWPANQIWCKNASVLIVVASRKNFAFNGKPSITHSFDAGAAVQNLALQAHDMGLIAHGMEGFDYEKARTDLRIPDTYAVEAMVAIGKPGPLSTLPPELHKAEELSDREKISAFTSEGSFRSKS